MMSPWHQLLWALTLLGMKHRNAKEPQLKHLQGALNRLQCAWPCSRRGAGSASARASSWGVWTGFSLGAVVLLCLPACQGVDDSTAPTITQNPSPADAEPSPTQGEPAVFPEEPTLTGKWCPKQKRLHYEVIFAAGNGPNPEPKNTDLTAKDWPRDWMMYLGFGAQGSKSSHPPRWNPEMPRTLFRIRQSFETYRLGSPVTLVVPALGHKGTSGWTFELAGSDSEDAEGCRTLQATGKISEAN